MHTLKHVVKTCVAHMFKGMPVCFVREISRRTAERPTTARGRGDNKLIVQNIENSVHSLHVPSLKYI